MINSVNDIKEGVVLSESSHYIVKEVHTTHAVVKHFESGDTTQIGLTYLKNYTNIADSYTEEVKVTKEDKKDGTLGIRSIFENIHSGQVFTVCFTKQDKPKSKKKYREEIEAKAIEFAEAVEKVKTSKKGVADFAKSAFVEMITNPVLPYEKGEDRVLRGYKVQFESRDGKYNCVDMDIERTDKENGIRPVNITTIKWLIFDGIRYVVE